jgi:hypothetical protein
VRTINEVILALRRKKSAFWMVRARRPGHLVDCNQGKLHTWCTGRARRGEDGQEGRESSASLSLPEETKKVGMQLTHGGDNGRYRGKTLCSVRRGVLAVFCSVTCADIVRVALTCTLSFFYSFTITRYVSRCLCVSPDCNITAVDGPRTPHGAHTAVSRYVPKQKLITICFTICLRFLVRLISVRASEPARPLGPASEPTRARLRSSRLVTFVH